MDNTLFNYPLRATRALIDLEALEHNLATLAARVPKCSLITAVKSDAYGHGATAVAEACQSWGVAMLAVANLEECLTLRDQGISIPILILGDLFPEEIETALTAGAVLSIGSLDYARGLSSAAERLGLRAVIHVNLETGMGRMGLYSPDPVSDLLKAASLPSVEVEGVFSHFPTSDESDKSFAYEQIAETRRILDEAADRGLRPRYRHIANSGAMIDFPRRVDWEMARPGVSIYGMYPSEDVDQSIGLKPVMRLVSRLIKVTRYTKETTIGYGRTYTAPPGSLVGIVPIGYGDGYPRSLSNRGEAILQGRRMPIIGRVSMDMIALDLSHLPRPPEIGDEVVLIGSQTSPGPSSGPAEQITVAELARLTGTITYEITCNFTDRVPRLYTRGGKTVAVKSFREGYKVV